MNNERKNKSDETLPSSASRAQRKKIYWILTAGFLLAVSVAAVVLLAWPSRTERFRRDLLEAIEENDRQRYFDVMSHVPLGEVVQFRNEEEKLALHEAHKRMLQIWLKENATLWNDEELEKRTIVTVVLSSRSHKKWGGTGLAQSEEGFELVKKAIEKLEEKYPSGPNREMFISRDKDGAVAVGMRSYSRRTRP